ncbi:ester cyclase [Geodermatophilus amargosae]|uniref:ester cyclase n=1 Tax=Geodermatophilus amargosae TaxID=1296565 RepID=UPI0034E02E5E
MTTTLTAVELAEQYLRGWNEHDGEAVAALFADGGTYVDPTLPEPLPKAALAGYVTALVAAFPDLVFVMEDVVGEGSRAYVRWRLQGTNSGPMPGLPEPTGGSCDLPGIDVVEVGADGITSVVGFLDQKTFLEQLGLRMDVVPG